MEVELKHTMAVSERALWLRFYLWLWEVEAEQATFCSLFWGYVFAPLGLLLRAGAYPVLLALEVVEFWKLRPRAKVDEALLERRRVQADEWRERIAAKRLRKRQRRRQLLAGIGAAGAVLVAHLHTPARVVGRVLAFLGLAIAGAVCVGTIGAAFYFGLKYLTITAIVLACLAALVIWCCLMVVVGKLLASQGAYEYVWAPIGRGASRGGLGFRDAMRTGYVAVKSNTCPRIEIRRGE